MSAKADHVLYFHDGESWQGHVQMWESTQEDCESFARTAVGKLTKTIVIARYNGGNGDGETEVATIGNALPEGH